MKRKISLALILIVSLITVNAAPPVAAEGKKIFSQRCQSCHAIDKVFVGPALAGLHERRNLDWIVKFVQSSQTMIKGGDKDATALFAKFNSIPMPDQADLSEQDIKNIVEFIKEEAVNAKAAPPLVRPSEEKPGFIPLAFSSASFFLPFTIGIMMIVGALLFYAKVKNYENTRIW